VVFDPGTIEDRSSYLDPHHYPEGIRHVVINGALVLEAGAMTGARPGVFLSRGRGAPR
jgi:N-acyl-D-amino-acid deacylase